MITLSKIAKLANVSVSTASKAFSGSKDVSVETRELIFDVAKRYGCFKRFYNARSPKLAIAVIAPEFTSAYYTRFLTSIQRQLSENSCELCVSVTDFSAEKERALLKYYYRHSAVDAIVVIGAQTVLQEEYEIPIGFISSVNPQKYGISISSSLEQGLEESIRYLVSRGVTEVGFIGEKLTKKKQERVLKLIDQYGLACRDEWVCVTDKRFEPGGYAAMQRLLEQKSLPRACFCAYDAMAVGAIRCLYDHGFQVPSDMAILGADDIPEAVYLNPPLATISTPIDRMCELMIQSIFQQINGEAGERQHRVNGEFHLRRSFEID